MSEKRKSAQASPFAQAEQEFAKLKDQFESGKLTEADLKARMQDLMVQDAQGQWWVIGYETGQWYVHVGKEWIRRDRPGESPAVTAVETVADSGQSPWETLWWPALVTSMGFAFSGQVLGSTLYFFLGYRGQATDLHFLGYLHGIGLHSGAAVAALLLGVITGLVTALLIKSLYDAITWKHVAIVAGGWGVLLGLSQVSIAVL
jgi:hypothetical protein